ncbi:hypothetical protein [Glycomyces paridis]|uniref:Uncharacterized protein n=1 Tax=Glycomyces paridis TaxID=2126555 RepID=A0A4S8PHX3_9ACTN|nr:hypothetical protein [Glycomyces paridis]THV30208.1 hypothetical protein E9998_07505 [Glycomyces paridis]
MTTSEEERIVRSAVAAAADLPREVIASIGDARTLELLGATTTLAILKKYRDKPGPQQISEFADELKFRFPDAADHIKPIVIEALVRFAFGEQDILDGISSDDLQTVLFMLPYAIISEENIYGEPLDAFVAEVVAAVNAEE